MYIGQIYDTLAAKVNQLFSAGGRVVMFRDSADGKYKAKLANGTIETFGDPGAADLEFVKLTLTSVQILDLNATPIEIIAAPGAGKAIQIITAMARVNFNTAAYATNTSLHLLFDTAVDIVFTISNALVATSIRIANGAPNTLIGTGQQIIENKKVDVTSIGGNPTVGDSTVDVYVAFRTVTL